MRWQEVHAEGEGGGATPIDLNISMDLNLLLPLLLPRKQERYPRVEKSKKRKGGVHQPGMEATQLTLLQTHSTVLLMQNHHRILQKRLTTSQTEEMWQVDLLQLS